MLAELIERFELGWAELTRMLVFGILLRIRFKRSKTEHSVAVVTGAVTLLSEALDMRADMLFSLAVRAAEPPDIGVGGLIAMRAVG